MSSEIMNAVTIYEVDGQKYTGAQKIDIKSHPRFLAFVRLCIDNREYSLACDDLIRAIERATCQLPPPEDGVLVGGPSDLITRFAEDRARERGNGRTELSRDEV